MITYNFHGGPRDGHAEAMDCDIDIIVLVLGGGQVGFYEWDLQETYEGITTRRMCWNADREELLEVIDSYTENQT